MLVAVCGEREPPEEAATALRELAAQGGTVVPRGGGTKPWGLVGNGSGTVLETGGLPAVVTAILEAA